MRWFTLDRDSARPLIRQIYHEISSQILSGELKAGERLPSTRETASELGVSRNVVMEAYEQLATEGFLLGISGAGTFVAKGSHLTIQGTPRAAPEAPEAAATAVLQPGPGEEVEPIDFCLGRPALDLAPCRTLARLEYECRLAVPAASLGAAPPEGQPELREALCAYLWRKRGVECSPGQIVITSGAVQGFSLLSALIPPRSEILFEDPGHPLARDTFQFHGAGIIPLPVDEEGACIDALPRVHRPALVFVTPSHQFPLGGCLSIQRRVALVEWARKTGCLVAEDDYESEFRYDVGPVSAIQGLDPGNVVYIGTFSKILFPALRLGYLVVPPHLVARCVAAKRMTVRYSAPAPQSAMARFMTEGLLDRHIARMRKTYRHRRDALIAALEEAFPGAVEILGRSTGLHIAASFAAGPLDLPRLAAIRREGAILHPVEDFAITKGRYPGLAAMGYSHLDIPELREGVARIERALSAVRVQ